MMIHLGDNTNNDFKQIKTTTSAQHRPASHPRPDPRIQGIVCLAAMFSASHPLMRKTVWQQLKRHYRSPYAKTRLGACGGIVLIFLVCWNYPGKYITW